MEKMWRRWFSCRFAVRRRIEVLWNPRGTQGGGDFEAASSFVLCHVVRPREKL